MRNCQHVLCFSMMLLFPVLGSVLSCGGGQADDDNESPTPNAQYGESLEDQMWKGWHSYEDDTIRLNLLTELAVFEYRDGLWCGRLTYDIGVVGTYFAYNELGTWVEMLNVTPQNVHEYEGLWIISRAYGSIEEGGFLTGWLDAVNDSSVPEPYEVPPMEEGDRDFDAYQRDDGSMRADPTAVTIGEYIALLSDASTQTTGGTTTQPSDETLALSVDMPSYDLPYYGTIQYNGTERTCGWCMQDNDPLAPEGGKQQ